MSDILFTTGDNSKVTVGATSTLVLDTNGARTYALLVNDSDETIYLALGEDAVMNEGIPLFTTGALEINGFKAYKGKVYGICASGGKSLSYFDSK